MRGTDNIVKMPSFEGGTLILAVYSNRGRICSLKAETSGQKKQSNNGALCE